MKLRVIPFLFFALATTIYLNAHINARADDSKIKDEDALTFCHFGPKMKVIQPYVSSENPNNKCSGNARIQGVMWECNSPNLAISKTTKMREELTKLAQEECTETCNSRGSGCKGKLEVPYHCGLEGDTNDSIILGKKFGCRSDCSGSAFIYCSLYNAGYRTDEPELTAKQPPNCQCTLSK